MRSTLVAALLTLGVSASAVAQKGEPRGAFADDDYQPNVPYTGRFTMARIKYTPLNTMAGFGGMRYDPKWDHDYRKSEFHFMKIMDELTTLKARTDASTIFTFDDPELFKFTVAYLCEPGFWNPSEKEIAGARAWLKKGGFLIIDDLVGNQMYNLEAVLRKVLPEARMIPLTAQHPIFDAFYRIESLDYEHPYFRGFPSVFFGIFEDNDPTKRMMAVIDYNNDISEYWEFSDTGFFPIALSNDAYKIGVNYVVYSLTR